MAKNTGVGIEYFSKMWSYLDSYLTYIHKQTLIGLIHQFLPYSMISSSSIFESYLKYIRNFIIQRCNPSITSIKIHTPLHQTPPFLTSPITTLNLLWLLQPQEIKLTSIQHFEDTHSASGRKETSLLDTSVRSTNSPSNFEQKIMRYKGWTKQTNNWQKNCRSIIRFSHAPE